MENSCPERGGQVRGPLRLGGVLALACVAALAFQGARGIYETSEGRYAECAREMVERGNWLEPVLNGNHHWTKPPLTYIAIGAPLSLLGNTAFAARLYLIPCYLASIAAVWWMGRRMWGGRGAADVCAMVYATSAVPMAASNVITTDCLLAASILLAQGAFWEAYRFPSKRWPGYALWLCMGVAFVTKGPPALLYLPAMVALWRRVPKGGMIRNEELGIEELGIRNQMGGGGWS
ncbi:MAG: glycosyltransferase family 39 protein, partial [Kiritimatiellaeota bacterium]|nr:glycosyltransferase family 39 protein [Kiritimatiellota bacterium]